MIGREELKMLFDYKNGELLWKVERGGSKIGDIAGSINKTGYRYICVNRKKFKAHRLIFLYHHGYLPEMIDHLDQNRLNNRVDNLRECTRAQNAFNSKIRKDNTSGIKGICWSKSNKKWMAQITVDRKYKYLGHFEDIDEAEKVIASARLRYHKSFASDGVAAG